MKFTTKLLGGVAFAAMASASSAFAGAHGGVCDTPSDMGDLGALVTLSPSWVRWKARMKRACLRWQAASKRQLAPWFSTRVRAISLIVADLRSGNAPNISIFPQPGLAGDMATDDFLTPLGDDAAAWMTDNYGAGSSWVALGTYAGPDGNEDFYGFAYKQDSRWFGIRQSSSKITATKFQQRWKS